MAISDATPPTPARRGIGPRAGVAAICAGIYCLLLLVPQGPLWPAPVAKIMATSKSAVYGFTTRLLAGIGVDKPTLELRQGAYLVLVAGLVPLMIALLTLRATPRTLGCRRPNRMGWRMLLLGFALALPFLFFMASGTGMQAYYVPAMKRAGTAAFLTYYAVNMVMEHFFFHGVLLGAFRPSGRWPTGAPLEPTTPAYGCCAGLRNWLGLGLRSGEPDQGAVTAWLGLVPNCGFAILASGTLFALIHVGKDWREAALSLPGGIAIAYIAYRGNSWLIPFFLHALTAGATLGLMLVL